VHFARATAFKNQAQRWSEASLSDVLDQLLDTEALCKTTAVPAESACGRALMNVAARAKTR
jgi:DNA polymerase-3 subunit delta